MATARDDGSGLGPTELSPTGHGPNIELSKDRLTVRYTGDGRSHDVGAIQVRVVYARVFMRFARVQRFL